MTNSNSQPKTFSLESNRSISAWSCCALILCSVSILPFVFIGSIIDPVLVPRFLLLSVLNALLIVVLLVARRTAALGSLIAATRNSITISLLLLLLMSAVSLTQAVNLAEGVFGLLRSTQVVIFCVLLVQVFYHYPMCLKMAVRGAVFTGLILSCIGIAQYLDLGFGWIPGNGLPSATMANRNLYASALLLTIPFALSEWFTSQSYWRFISLASWALSLIAIVVSQTRAVWLALLVVAVATAMVAWGTRRTARAVRSSRLRDRRSAPVRSALLIAAILLAIGAFTVAQNKGPSDRQVSRDLLSTQSLKVRLFLWTRTVDMWLESPILGHGPEQWRILFPKLGSQGWPPRLQLGTFIYQNPHNDYLWVLAETGVFGFLLYCAVFGYALRQAYYVINSPPDRDSGILALFMLLGIIGYAVDAIFSYPRARIFHGVYFSLMLAIVISQYRTVQPATMAVRRNLGIALYLFFALFTVVGVLVGWSRINAEIHTKRAVHAGLKKDWQTVSREAGAAQSPWTTLDPTGMPIAKLKGVALFESGDYAAALECFKTSYTQSPYQIQVLDNLATCYAATGDASSAILICQRVLDLSPNHENALLNLAVLYYDQGDTARATEYFLAVPERLDDIRYNMLLEALGDSLMSIPRSTP